METAPKQYNISNLNFDQFLYYSLHIEHFNNIMEAEIEQHCKYVGLPSEVRQVAQAIYRTNMQPYESTDFAGEETGVKMAACIQMACQRCGINPPPSEVSKVWKPLMEKVDRITSIMRSRPGR